MSQKASNPVIKNKRASFEYEFVDTYEAGIQLQGTEIKSIRQGKASIGEGYCYFSKNELFIKNMHIAEYDHGNINNHDPLRERKLLLKKFELNKLNKKLNETGLTLIPVKLYINEAGIAKLKIALAKGKKIYDKRDSIKQKDVSRDLDRLKKQF